MAAHLRYGVRSPFHLAKHLCRLSPTTACNTNGMAVSPCVISFQVDSTRFYRGSNRDIRRKEKRLLEKLRLHRDVETVFDFPTFIRCNYEKELFCFQKRLQLEFDDVSLLKEALTHSSFLKKCDDTVEDPYDRDQLSTQSCERLALYGFKFSSQTITDFIVRSYPVIDKNLMDEMLRFMLSRKTISQLGELLAIPDLVLIEHNLDTINSNKSLSFTRDDVICDSLFALIGAICKDKDENVARKFLLDFLWPLLQGSSFIDEVKLTNSEASLSAMLQLLGRGSPVPRILAETGKNTDYPVYVVGIFSDEQVLSQAASYTVKKARQDAYFKSIFQLLEENACLHDLK